MTKKRGGYGHKMNVVKFRADETLNARLKEVARANQSAVARVVREMVVFALADLPPTGGRLPRDNPL